MKFIHSNPPIYRHRLYRREDITPLVSDTPKKVSNRTCCLFSCTYLLPPDLYLFTSTFSKINEALIQWFNQEWAIGTAISEDILEIKADFFHQVLDCEGEFKASSGCVNRFKKRYGIKSLKISGEKLSANHDAAQNFVKGFQKFFRREDLSLEIIYNADESGLYRKCLPNSTLASEKENSVEGLANLYPKNSPLLPPSNFFYFFILKIWVKEVRKRWRKILEIYFLSKKT